MLENACLLHNIGMLQIILHLVKTKKKQALDKTITNIQNNMGEKPIYNIPWEKGSPW